VSNIPPKMPAIRPAIAPQNFFIFFFVSLFVFSSTCKANSITKTPNIFFNNKELNPVRILIPINEPIITKIKTRMNSLFMCFFVIDTRINPEKKVIIAMTGTTNFMSKNNDNKGTMIKEDPKPVIPFRMCARRTIKLAIRII